MSQINLRCPSGSSVYRNNGGEGWFRLLLSGVIIYLSKVEKKRGADTNVSPFILTKSELGHLQEGPCALWSTP